MTDVSTVERPASDASHTSAGPNKPESPSRVSFVRRLWSEPKNRALLVLAGAIMVFLDQRSVIRYLGPDAKPVVAYGVASVSGTILAVCSCTVLPIFKGIYRKGAGIGPAVSFLYSGPAINVLAIVLTAKVLGFELGIARAVGAIVFAVVIGLLMHLIFHREDAERVTNAAMFQTPDDAPQRGLGRTCSTGGSTSSSADSRRCSCIRS